MNPVAKRSDEKKKRNCSMSPKTFLRIFTIFEDETVLALPEIFTDVENMK